MSNVNVDVCRTAVVKLNDICEVLEIGMRWKMGVVSSVASAGLSMSFLLDILTRYIFHKNALHVQGVREELRVQRSALRHTTPTSTVSAV